MRNFGIDIFSPDGRHAVQAACHVILSQGEPAYPRGKVTKELLFARITVMDPTDVVADGVQRKGLLPAIGYGEGLQCVAGMSAPGLMADISSGFPRPSSRWSTEVPTYGERLGEHDQLAECAATLRERDEWSRQCVALVWRPDDQVAGQAHNLCTIGLQFILRDGRLHMGVHMRSNDAWHGLPYDLQQFAMVQCSMANAVGADVGLYVHTANSLHLYEQHWERAGDMRPASPDFERKPRPAGVGRFGDDWSTIRSRAAMLIRGEGLFQPTDSEVLMQEALAKYTNKEES